MLITEIPLEEIDLEDETFRISEELDPAPLLESLREVGQLNPVVLLGENGRKKVVCGFRRARAARTLRMPHVFARTLAEGTNPERVFLMALQDNLSHRELIPLEKARALSTLRNSLGVPDGKLVRVYLPLLKLDPGERVLRSYILLHRIHPGLRRCYAEGRLTHASIAAVAEMPRPAQDSIAATFEKIRMSTSLQKKFLELLEDLASPALDQSCPPLQSAEVVAIINDSRLSHFQRGEKVYEALYRLRNPKLSKASDEFDSHRKRLGLPGAIRIAAHPFFEEAGLRVEFDAPDIKRFRQMVTALEKAAHSPELATLFNPVRLESRELK
jgi:hypothetical protein